MMRPPAFWWQDTPNWAATCLAPLGKLYGWLTLRRMAGAGQRASCRVICIGNFTTGGSGKTPVATHVAQLLIARGEKPVFLSRGYGGRIKAATRVDPALHSAEDVGDEPLLLSRVAPVIISPDRAAGAAMAVASGASVIVMDDGLQNPHLVKDLTLAVVDGATGFGNGLVFPAGPLRASVEGQRPFVDVVIVIGEGAGLEQAKSKLEALPLLGARLLPTPEAVQLLSGQKVIAMAGIGLPAKFEATLLAMGADVVDRHFVADHSAYALTELRKIAAHAAMLGALVATTEKDAVRIGAGLPPELAERLVIVPVKLSISHGQDVLERLLNTALDRRKAGA